MEANNGKWTRYPTMDSKAKGALILSILKGQTTVQEAARSHGLTMGEIEDWKDKFLLGA